METVKIVKELPVSSSGASGIVVKKGGLHFCVSSVNATFTGFETLVFPCDADGEVTDWSEIAGGRGVSREEAIEELEQTSTEDLKARMDGSGGW